jgi:hypothetical protein
MKLSRCRVVKLDYVSTSSAQVWPCFTTVTSLLFAILGPRDTSWLVEGCVFAGGARRCRVGISASVTAPTLMYGYSVAFLLPRDGTDLKFPVGGSSVLPLTCIISRRRVSMFGYHCG